MDLLIAKAQGSHLRQWAPLPLCRVYSNNAKTVLDSFRHADKGVTTATTVGSLPSQASISASNIEDSFVVRELKRNFIKYNINQDVDQLKIIACSRPVSEYTRVLDDEDKLVIYLYTTNYMYEMMNEAAREMVYMNEIDKFSEWIHYSLKLVDALCKLRKSRRSSNNQVPDILYRCTTLPLSIINDIILCYGSHQPATIGGFTSTSVKMITWFAMKNSWKKEYEMVVMEFWRCDYAEDIHELAWNPSESEWLLPLATQFFVCSIRKEEQHWVIRVTDNVEYLSYMYPMVNSVADRLSFLKETPSPNSRSYHCAVAHDNRMYVCCGEGSHPTLEVYDYNSRTWSSSLGNRGGGPACNTYGASAVLYNGCIYVFGGHNGQHMCNDLFKYDISRDLWTHEDNNGNPPTPRYFHSAAVLEHSMYIFGGQDSGRPHYVNDLFRYDFDTCTWTNINGISPPSARHNHLAVAVNHMMYIIGGHNGTSGVCYNDIHIYNPLANAWSIVRASGRPPAAVHGASYVIIANDIYVVFGRSYNTVHSNIYCYNIETHAWRIVAPINNQTVPQPRSGHSCVLLGDNACYIFGGIDKDYRKLNDMYMINL